MAEFIYISDATPDTVHIVIRVPRRLWDRWESKHVHFGKAIHSLRESVVEMLAAKGLSSDRDTGDPFWRG